MSQSRKATEQGVAQPERRTAGATFCTKFCTGDAMAKMRPSEDIRSLSDFRANVAGAVRDVRRRRRPIFLAQHGRGAAVLMDVSEYEALLEELELLRDVRTAERQLAAGRGVSQSAARKRLLSRLRR